MSEYTEAELAKAIKLLDVRFPRTGSRHKWNPPLLERLRGHRAPIAWWFRREFLVEVQRFR
jgi:hypothetical protein